MPARTLNDKLVTAKIRMTELSDQLELLEETARQNGLPLDEWKAQERKFIRDILGPDPRKYIKHSPYEVKLDHGKPTPDCFKCTVSYSPTAPSLQECLAQLNQSSIRREIADHTLKRTFDMIESSPQTQPSIQDLPPGYSGAGELIAAALDIEQEQ